MEKQKSTEAGELFLLNSMETVNFGGMAMHGIEIILDSLEASGIEDEPHLWRVQDIIHARDQLCQKGYNVRPLDFKMGDGYYDLHPDQPPFIDLGTNHIKLVLNGRICTTFMLIVEVPLDFKSGTPFPCNTSLPS